MTEADLKTVILKSPCVTLGYLFKTKKIYFSFFHFPAFFRHFFQTIRVIGLIFFLWAGLKKLGYEHAFQPYTYSLRPFSRGGPQAIHRFRPPAFIGLSIAIKSFSYISVFWLSLYTSQIIAESSESHKILDV